MFVAIAGNIGVGKSTLTSLASERFHLTPIFEAVDQNPYLADFYRDMPRYAFHSQMFFLAARLRQHLAQVNPADRVVQDRTVYEDAYVFARALYQAGTMDARDYASYTLMFEAVEQTLRPPDLLVYLRGSLATLKQRIAERGRPYEQTIEESYLERLGGLYDDWVASYDRSPVLVIDADRLDFQGSQSDRESIFSLLEEHGVVAPVVR